MQDIKNEINPVLNPRAEGSLMGIPGTVKFLIFRGLTVLIHCDWNP